MLGLTLQVNRIRTHLPETSGQHCATCEGGAAGESDGTWDDFGFRQAFQPDLTVVGSLGKASQIL